MKRLMIAVLVLGLFTLGVARAEDAPTSSRWMLTLEHGPLKIVPVHGLDGQTVTYHYIVLKVTNPTSLPRDWHPLVKALTDTRRTYVAAGYEAALGDVQEQEANADLVALSATLGKIAPGQTLQTAAIFGPVDPLYDEIRIQVLGLADPVAIYKVERWDVEVETPGIEYTQTVEGSGEPQPITSGITVQDVAYLERNRQVLAAAKKTVGEGELPKPTVEYWEVRERRVYEMIFTRLGDEFRPDDDMISPGKEYWTVVGDVRLERQIRM